MCIVTVRSALVAAPVGAGAVQNKLHVHGKQQVVCIGLSCGAHHYSQERPLHCPWELCGQDCMFMASIRLCACAELVACANLLRSTPGAAPGGAGALRTRLHVRGTQLVHAHVKSIDVNYIV